MWLTPQPDRLLLLVAAVALCVCAATSARADELPREALSRLYRAALEDRFDEDRLDHLIEAHRLLEKYFAEPDDARQRDIVQRLAQLEPDTALLARIVHIRLGWPALEPGAYYINEPFGQDDVHYFLGVPPGYDRTRAWPLVIRLPGAHAFITDPPPTPEQVVQIYAAWIEDELARHPDALVLMPLLNLGEFYGPSHAGMNSVIQPMLHAFDRVHIDPRRVYLVGHGMSAHAVWNLALHYPTWFAAINPLAGAASADWQRLRLVNLRNVLPVVWHDTNDLTIRVSSSRWLVQRLRQLGQDVIYEETSGLGHTPPQRQADALYEQMRARVRELHPQQVIVQSNRIDPIFNRADWLTIEPADPGPAQRLRLAHGSGEIIIHQHPWRAEARIEDDNTIAIAARNAGRMRIYLNDEMLDMDRPVRVLVNNRPRFEGLPRPDLQQMLEDQRFLGRGWRDYIALIQIE